mmetsp:Transcript_35823/g.43788  ORF Transcript_35823/g.43788 Transcript_35823/m.43788 type:complete len:155 (-) Transcript_35823:163-627(-)|eukprot:scaffold1762_cov39-Tisochrysis_lutea.AAC.2
MTAGLWVPLITKRGRLLEGGADVKNKRTHWSLSKATCDPVRACSLKQTKHASSVSTRLTDLSNCLVAAEVRQETSFLDDNLPDAAVRVQEVDKGREDVVGDLRKVREVPAGLRPNIHDQLEDGPKVADYVCLDKIDHVIKPREGGVAKWHVVEA